jgi:hypothetical protein
MGPRLWIGKTVIATVAARALGAPPRKRWPLAATSRTATRTYAEGRGLTSKPAISSDCRPGALLLIILLSDVRAPYGTDCSEKIFFNALDSPRFFVYTRIDMKIDNSKFSEARGAADIVFGLLVALGGIYFVAHVALWASRGFEVIR